MIVGPEDWQQLWDVIDDEFSQSAEKGLAVIFSVQEVETVCAIKMLQVRASRAATRSSAAWPGLL